MTTILFLGSLELYQEEEALFLSDFYSAKVVALLAYLVLEEGEHTRSHLASLLWGEYPAKRARANLRNTLYNLNKRIPQHLTTTRQTVTYHATATTVDVAQLEQALLSNAPIAIVQELYRGTLLEGLDITDAPLFEEWLRDQRTRLEVGVATYAEAVATRHAEQGEWEACAIAARFLLSIVPWSELGHASLMRVRIAQEDYGAAIAQYQRYVTSLQAALRVGPSPEMKALLAAAKRQRAYATVSLQPRDVPMVGRQEELERLLRLLEKPNARLITLVGLGGVGKTTIAAKVFRSYAAGQATFIDLSSERGQRSLILQLAAAFYLSDTMDNFVDSFVDVIGPEPHLLVIDNVDAYAAEFIHIAHMLDRAPNLHIIVTSREPLNLSQEITFDVHGLKAADAQRLFRQEAQRVSPGIELEDEAVEQICEAVGGLPLGIILAAGWLGTLPVQAIAHELQTSLTLLRKAYRDRPERHHHMRPILQRTWEQLTSNQQHALMQMSLFEGPFTRRDFMALLIGHLHELRGLVNKGVITFTGETYTTHPLVRQFVRAQHTASPLYPHHVEAFATYTLTLLQKDYRHEHPLPTKESVFAAWGYAVDHDMHRLLRKALRGFSFYCASFGYYVSAKQALEGVLEMADPLLRLRAHQQLVWNNIMLGNIPEAEQQLAQFHELADTLAEVPLVEQAYITFFAGMVASTRGEMDRAFELLQKAKTLSEQTSDTIVQTGVSLMLGVAFLLQQDFESAEVTFQQASDVSQHSAQKALVESCLATLYAVKNEGQIAVTHCLTCFELASDQWRSQPAFLTSLAALALVLAQRGEGIRAGVLASYVLEHPSTQVWVRPLLAEVPCHTRPDILSQSDALPQAVRVGKAICADLLDRDT